MHYNFMSEVGHHAMKRGRDVTGDFTQLCDLGATGLSPAMKLGSPTEIFWTNARSLEDTRQKGRHGDLILQKRAPASAEGG